MSKLLERKPPYRWFSSVLVELEFGDVSKRGGRKTAENAEKTLGTDATTNNKLDPHGTGLESNSGDISGRRAFVI